MTVPSGPAVATGGATVPVGRRFAGVLFDMDGTLVDSTASVVRCWVRLAEELGVGPDRLRAAAGHGRPARDIVADLLPGEGATVRAAALARITALEVSDVEGVVALPGAVAALTAAGARGAIVTSCTRDLAVARWSAAGLPVPPVVVTADDVARGKPDPEPFRSGARLLGVDPADCLVVEDAPAGLVAGRAAGAATLAVTTTHAAEDLDADLVVPDLAAVRWHADADGVTLLPA